MSFDKSVQSGKEHRKQYTGAKFIDRTCRNHGSCVYCRENRTHKNDKRKLAVEQRLKENQGSCKWLYDEVCCNGDCDMRADFPDEEYCRRCEYFEEE